MLGSRFYWRTILFWLMLFVLALALGLGCRKELPELFDRNQPPETFIDAAPVESLVDGFEVTVYWHAVDPDGEIAYYMWAWTDSSRAFYSAWNPERRPEDRVPSEGEFDATHWTTRTDSTFIVKANDNGGTSRDLTFNVTAVDDQGRRDPIPARRYFWASVDHRPQIIWLQEPPETLSVGETFSCRFTYDPDMVNGGFLGFKWSAGSETTFQPLLNGAPVWTSSHPDWADSQAITLTFSNDVSETDPDWRSHYKYGTFPIKAKCLDLAGVESEISTSSDHLRGAMLPILNRDPDTRLRPIQEEHSNFPVVVEYLDINGEPASLLPSVTLIDEWQGEPLDPGFHYLITDTIPWGEDVHLEFNFQGWDQDHPMIDLANLYTSKREDMVYESTSFQMDYRWTLPRLNPPHSLFPASSAGRFPAGGRPGLGEVIDIPGQDIHLPAGESFWMNVGPFDYIVKGYTIDSWGRVDGTPASIRFTGGFIPHVGDVWIEPTGFYSGIDLPTVVPINLSELARTYGTAEVAFMAWDSQVIWPFFGEYALDLFGTPDRVILSPDSTWTVGIGDDARLKSRYYLGLRVDGIDDIRNGSEAMIGRFWWDMLDPEFEESQDQFDGIQFMAEVGGMRDWYDLGEPGPSGSAHFVLAYETYSALVHFCNSETVGEGWPPPERLGEKTLRAKFCNTASITSFKEMIEDEVQREMVLVYLGRTSDVAETPLLLTHARKYAGGAWPEDPPADGCENLLK